MASVNLRIGGLIGLIYILAGLYFAFVNGYITASLLKGLASALLAIFLWPLILLGIDLHIR